MMSRVWRTVKEGLSPSAWRTAPTRPARTASLGATPRTAAVPASGRVKPRTTSRVVDLPAPFGPRKATTSPGATVRSRESTATTGPKVLRRPRTRTAGLSGVGPAGPAAAPVMTGEAGVLLMP